MAKDLPNLRNVIHGDYGYGNVLVDNNIVTAVLDWPLSMYGDPLFDIARLHFWRGESDFDYLKEYQNRHNKINDKKIRINTYVIDIGLSSIWHYFKRKNVLGFKSAIANLKKKLLIA